MDKRYIVIGESIWSIENESDIYYEVSTRDTWGRVNKSESFVKQGSSLLWYEGEDIEIKSSNIEIETEEDYQKYLDSIQEYTEEDIYENIDLGYLEPEDNEEWDLI